MKRSWKFIGFAGLLTLASCFKDEYNFNDINTDAYSPSFALPLIDATVNLGEIMENVDTTQIKADENNLLRITYSDTLMSYDVAELVEIPTQNITEAFTLPAFTIDNLNNSASVSLSEMANNMAEPQRSLILGNNGNTLPFPAMPSQSIGSYALTAFTEFNSVTFSQGTLTIEITNNWAFDVENLTMDIINSGDASVIGTFTYASIPSGQTRSDQVDLTGVTMTNTLAANITGMESPGTGVTPVLIDLASTLDVTSIASGLEVSSGAAIFPSQSAVNETVDVDLTLNNGEELNSVQLNTGSIDYSIDYGLRENSQITISLPYITSNGTPITEVINVTSDGANPQVVVGSIDLANHTIDLTANGSNTNYIQADISASIISSGRVIPFSTNDAIEANLDISNLDIAFVDGYLGNMTELIPADTITIDLFDNEFSELISLAAPEFSMRMVNSAGIPVEADMTITAYNDQTSLALTGIDNPLTINAPDYSQIGQTALTEVNLTRDNSNIADIFNLNPTGIAYAMEIETNPAGNTGAMNFINSDSKIDVTMDVNVPMYGSVNGFSIEDTLDLALDSIGFLQSATIRAIIENEFPVDVDVQLYFVDENFNVLDSLFENGETLVQSSAIDANGDMTAPTISETDIVLTEDKLDNLFNANQIILRSNLATGNGGTQDAKFYTHYEMNINLGIIATVQLNQQ